MVTGGGGFIGSHLTRALLAQGYAVRVLDNFFSGHRENLAEILDDIELIDDAEGLLSLDVCERAVRDVDFILHQGAVPSVPRSLANPVCETTVDTLWCRLSVTCWIDVRSCWLPLAPASAILTAELSTR